MEFDVMDDDFGLFYMMMDQFEQLQSHSILIVQSTTSDTNTSGNNNMNIKEVKFCKSIKRFIMYRYLVES